MILPEFANAKLWNDDTAEFVMDSQFVRFSPEPASAGLAENGQRPGLPWGPATLASREQVHAEEIAQAREQGPKGISESRRSGWSRLTDHPTKPRPVGRGKGAAGLTTRDSIG